MALDLAQHLKSVKKDEALVLLKKAKDYPESFLDDPEMKGLAQAMIEEANAPVIITITLKTDSPPYSVYGAGFIEEGARNQMDIAMKLPVTLGAGLDEAPMAYKDINMVMNAQQDLVNVIARFRPKS